MNERIRLLADHAKAYANQCTKDLDGDIAWHWMDYYTEKFAELIVQECAQVAEEIDGDSRARKCVLEHFGVEE